jgi:hypothetical protein
MISREFPKKFNGHRRDKIDWRPSWRKIDSATRNAI